MPYRPSPDEKQEIRDLLTDWEDKNGYSGTAAAQACGYSYNMYFRIRRGDVRPSIGRILGFQETTGVPGTLFYPEIRGVC